MEHGGRMQAQWQPQQNPATPWLVRRPSPEPEAVIWYNSLLGSPKCSGALLQLSRLTADAGKESSLSVSSANSPAPPACLLELGLSCLLKRKKHFFMPLKPPLLHSACL
ncbi:Hypothetical predicted protein [Podarcis lilfordi]|uniref:Uncharacterized protein n=1 Tax=Podarcis lilfordi TaxID=74358 RepID=A0AA35PBW7_9SAUR|nr:Hypothetical predicted protein [Podarcis lilfordi]